MADVALHLTPHGDGDRVLVNGHDLTRSVRALVLAAGDDQPTRLILSLAVRHQAEATGAMVVEVDEPARSALLAIGWQPPPDNGQ